MTSMLVMVGVITIVLGFLWLYVRLDRASRKGMKRRREAWRAGKSAGLAPKHSSQHLPGGGGIIGGGGCGGAGGCGGGGGGCGGGCCGN